MTNLKTLMSINSTLRRNKITLSLSFINKRIRARNFCGCYHIIIIIFFLLEYPSYCGLNIYKNWNGMEWLCSGLLQHRSSLYLIVIVFITNLFRRMWKPTANYMIRIIWLFSQLTTIYTFCTYISVDNHHVAGNYTSNWGNEAG